MSNGLTDREIRRMFREGKSALEIIKAVIDSKPDSSLHWAKERIVSAITNGPVEEPYGERTAAIQGSRAS